MFLKISFVDNESSPFLKILLDVESYERFVNTTYQNVLRAKISTRKDGTRRLVNRTLNSVYYRE